MVYCVVETRGLRSVEGAVNFEKLIIKPKIKEVPEGIMVRPSLKTREWLAKIASKHNTSVNKVVLAIIESEFNKVKGIES